MSKTPIRDFIKQYCDKYDVCDAHGKDRLAGQYSPDAITTVCPRCNKKGVREGSGPQRRDVCDLCDGVGVLPTAKRGIGQLELLALVLEPELVAEAQPDAIAAFNAAGEREHAARLEAERVVAEKKHRAELVRDMLGEALENGAGPDEIAEILRTKKTRDAYSKAKPADGGR